VGVQVHQAGREKKVKDYGDLCKQLTNARKSLQREIKDAYRKDYFFRIHNEMMKRQLLGPVAYRDLRADIRASAHTIEHQLEERTRLQQVLCDLSKDLSPQAIVARKVSAINLMVALASRQEFQTRKPRSALASKDLVKK
jgi:hypothetical protein